MRRWLCGSTSPTEEELSRMPEFGGERADTYRAEWLRIDRGSRLRSFLSGEGDSPFDGNDNFISEHAEHYRRMSKSIRRKSALGKWLSGAEE